MATTISSTDSTYKPVNTYVDSSSSVEKTNTANGVTTNTGEKSAAADLNFETFLKLLTVQLQYQDPMNPMEDTEWTTQLAQYSTLEAQLESNKLLEQMASNNSYNLESLAISYIGKEALVPGSVTATDGSTYVSINYDQDTQSQATNINIYKIVTTTDDDGNVTQSKGDLVRSLEGTTYDGRNEVIWDSKDGDGNPVEQGYYVFEVTAADTEGKSINATEYTYAHISSVEKNQDGELAFTMSDGRMTTMDKILLVREAASSTGNTGDSSSGSDTTDPETTPETEDDAAA